MRSTGAIDIMRKRVDQLGVAEPEIQRTGARPDRRRPARTCRTPTRAEQAGRQDRPAVLLRLGAERARPRRQAGRRAEPNRSRAAPTAPAPVGVRRLHAVRRGHARRQARRRSRATTRQRAAVLHVRQTEQRACTAAGKGREPSPSRRQRCSAGPDDTKQDLLPRLPTGVTDRRRRSSRSSPRARSSCRPPESKLHAPARSATRAPTASTCSTTTPALSGTDIKNPQQNFDQAPAAPASRTSRSTSPTRAERVRRRSPRDIAQRGQRQPSCRARRRTAFQHFAIALDDELISVAVRSTSSRTPTASTAANGSQISGGFTISSAQDLANAPADRRAADQARADLASRRSRRRSASRRCTRA